MRGGHHFSWNDFNRVNPITVLQIYEAWETDKIISVELWRNLSLCLIAVAIISLILLGDFRWTIQTSLWNYFAFIFQVDCDGRHLHPRHPRRSGQLSSPYHCLLLSMMFLYAIESMAIMVFVCYLYLYISKIGTLHFWDVTIDVIVCVNIVLACGLCVDYSVHIAHSFSVATGEHLILGLFGCL